MSEKYVLVVDDDKDIQSAIQMILEIHDYKVVCVSNGQEALDFLKSQPKPSIILLDIMMPVMDGFEFIKHVDNLKFTPRIPIIAMTAARNLVQDVKEHVLLFKPFDVDKLLKVVRLNFQQVD